MGKRKNKTAAPNLAQMIFLKFFLFLNFKGKKEKQNCCSDLSSTDFFKILSITKGNWKNKLNASKICV